MTAEENQKKSIDDLHQQLVLLRQSENEIELIKDKLNQERTNIDKILLPQQAKEWDEHREKHFNDLAIQLEANGIILNSAEKKELRDGSRTITSVQEKLNALKKLHIEIQDTASDFVVIVYDAIAAEQSRKLKKIDNSTIKNIVKKLDVIDDENKASRKLKADHAKQYEEIIETVAKLSEQLDKAKALYTNTENN